MNIIVKQIVTSPNQRIVITHKTKSDTEHLYSIDNLEAVRRAAKELPDRAFKLYMRMNLNQDEYTYALSPKAICEEFGISEGKYREAVRDLIAKGYMRQSDEQKNVYHFFENPADDMLNCADDMLNSAVDTLNGADDVLNCADKQLKFTDEQQDCADEQQKLSTSYMRGQQTNNTSLLQRDSTKDITRNITTDSKGYNSDIYNKDSTTAKPDLKISNSSILDDVADYISDCCIKSNKDNSTVYDTDLMDYEAVMSDDCIPF